MTPRLSAASRESVAIYMSGTMKLGPTAPRNGCIKSLWRSKKSSSALPPVTDLLPRPDRLVPKTMRHVGVPLDKATEDLGLLSNGDYYIARGDERIWRHIR
jgi:hypothetical protein